MRQQQTRRSACSSSRPLDSTSASKRVNAAVEKLGLPEEPLGAAVDLDARLQAVDHQPIEVVHRAVAPAQLVVERQDLDDEARPEPEGRGRAAGAGRRSGAREEHLALEGGEHGRRRRQPLVQPA